MKGPRLLALPLFLTMLAMVSCASLAAAQSALSPQPSALSEWPTRAGLGARKADSSESPALSTQHSALRTDPVSALAEAPLDLVAARTFQLPVPFRTQRDGDRFQGSNCGPAALAMVFGAYGMVESNVELRFRSHSYQGTAGRRGGTALQHLARVAEDFGLEPLGLYQGPDFRRWTMEDIRAEPAAGRPVIPLVKYRLLPGHEGSRVRFDHYIVIYGIDGDQFLYHDPAYASEEEGAGQRMSEAPLDAASRAAVVPRQAVAFGSGARELAFLAL